MSKGLEYHNPGNIRITGDRWKGLDIAATEQRRRDGDNFCAFDTPAYGIRAMCILLFTYQDKRTAPNGTPIDTIAELVDRWAPPGDDNPTDNYVAFLASETGFRRGELLDFHDYPTMRSLIPAIITFEQGGCPYPASVIDKGLNMAGLESPAKPLKGSRTVKGAAVAVAGAGAAALEEVVPVAAQLSPVLTIIKAHAWWLAPAIIILGAAIVVYARMDDRKKGLR